MTDPLDIPKYRNAAHALYLILREEGPKTLYRGVALTALRQSTNQGALLSSRQFAPLRVERALTPDDAPTAANFTAYTELKRLLQKWQPQYPDGGLPAWQTGIIGLISGAVGPFTNAPIDTIKCVRSLVHFLRFTDDARRRTRIQRATALKGETAWTRFTTVAGQMFKDEGPQAFYKGITPRVMRVAPGQAVRCSSSPLSFAWSLRLTRAFWRIGCVCCVREGELPSLLPSLRVRDPMEHC